MDPAARERVLAKVEAAALADVRLAARRAPALPAAPLGAAAGGVYTRT